MCVQGMKGRIGSFMNLIMELKKCCNHAFLVCVRVQGMKGSIGSFMNLIMELKKCCNHAFLVRSPDSSDEPVDVDRFEVRVRQINWLDDALLPTFIVQYLIHCVLWHIFTCVSADRTATQYGRLLASSCHLFVCLSVCLWRCALWLSGSAYRAKSCTSVFLFVRSDTSSVRCII